jgi:hypothetical protein
VGQQFRLEAREPTELEKREMDRKEAFRFLRAHQPLPADTSLDEETIGRFDEGCASSLLRTQTLSVFRSF